MKETSLRLKDEEAVARGAKPERGSEGAKRRYSKEETVWVKVWRKDGGVAISRTNMAGA